MRARVWAGRSVDAWAASRAAQRAATMAASMEQPTAVPRAAWWGSWWVVLSGSATLYNSLVRTSGTAVAPRKYIGAKIGAKKPLKKHGDQLD
jgi:hypothetical protein